MYVCMYCVYVCMYVCMYTCMRVCNVCLFNVLRNPRVSHSQVPGLRESLSRIANNENDVAELKLSNSKKLKLWE